MEEFTFIYHLVIAPCLDKLRIGSVCSRLDRKRKKPGIFFSSPRGGPPSDSRIALRSLPQLRKIVGHVSALELRRFQRFARLGRGRTRHLKLFFYAPEGTVVASWRPRDQLAVCWRPYRVSGRVVAGRMMATTRPRGRDRGSNSVSSFSKQAPRTQTISCVEALLRTTLCRDPEIYL